MVQNQELFQIMHYFKLLNEKLPLECKQADNGKWCENIGKIFQQNCEKLQELISNLENEILSLKTKIKK